MRTFLNTWLRRWAEASLRQELYIAQEKVIRLQDIKDRLISQSQEQARVHKKKMETLKSNHKKSTSHDTRLIRALRERMSEEMFLSTAAYVRVLEEVKAQKP